MVKHTRRLRGGWSLFGSKKEISNRCNDLVEEQINAYKTHIEEYKIKSHTEFFKSIIAHIDDKISKSGLIYNKDDRKERINNEYNPLLKEVFDKFDDQLSRKADIYKEKCDKTDPMNSNLFSIYLKDDKGNHINLFDNYGKLIQFPVILDTYMKNKEVISYGGGKRKQTKRRKSNRTSKRTNKRKN